MRNFFILLIFFIMAATVFADGFAYSKGVETRIQETHQLAIIKLQEKHADVSMYISIIDIPEGKTITYVLPFWYRPDNFTMTEDNASSIFSDKMRDINDKIKDLNSQALTDYSVPLEFAWIAPFSGLLPGISPIFKSARVKSRESVIPYQVVNTPHAKAMLYKIDTGGNDLQKLVRESGLPEKLIYPLRKYNTQYFAVMKLTGVKKADNDYFGRGIMYNFSHQLKDNKYTYPLGTGAAWAKPIPLTEVFITCPDNMQLKVDAPIYGQKVDRYKFRNNFINYVRSTDSDKDLSSYSNDIYSNEMMTTSNIDDKVKNPSIWHTAYYMTNPANDITATISKRQNKNIFHDSIRLLFLNTIIPWVLTILCVLFSWFMTYHFIIKPYCIKNNFNTKSCLDNILLILTAELIIFNITILFISPLIYDLHNILNININYHLEKIIMFILLFSASLFLWFRCKNNLLSIFRIRYLLTDEYEREYKRKRFLCFWTSYLIFLISTQSLVLFYDWLSK